MWVASIGGHFWISQNSYRGQQYIDFYKSAAEVTNESPLVCHFQKGKSCWGKYAFFGWPPLEVTSGGNLNQLQRAPFHCPWSAISKKVYHVGLNMQYFGCLHYRSFLKVSKISCRGH